MPTRVGHALFYKATPILTCHARSEMATPTLSRTRPLPVGPGRTRKLRVKSYPSDLFPLLASVPPSSLLALYVTAALLSVLCCLT